MSAEQKFRLKVLWFGVKVQLSGGLLVGVSLSGSAEWRPRVNVKYGESLDLPVGVEQYLCHVFICFKSLPSAPLRSPRVLMMV